jgi:hypothetical protein
VECPNGSNLPSKSLDLKNWNIYKNSTPKILLPVAENPIPHYHNNSILLLLLEILGFDPRKEILVAEILNPHQR